MLSWKTPKFTNHRAGEDVYIRAAKASSYGRDCATISFYDGAEKRICNHYNSIAVAVVPNRLYFKEKPNEYGYKMCKAGKTRRCIISDKDVTAFCKTHKGHYHLKYDVVEKAYYIDVSKE